MMARRSTIVAAVTAAVLAAGTAQAFASTAIHGKSGYGPYCTSTGTHSTNTTYVSVGSCYDTQARIQRVVDGIVKTFDSPITTGSSSVSASIGYPYYYYGRALSADAFGPWTKIA
jgi:hypothetical protein